MASVPSIDMFPGVVRAQTSGGNPGPGSAMTYKVLVNFRDGAREVDGIRPAVEQWPDTMNVNPIRAGSFVVVGAVQGQLQLAGRELPHFAPCQSPGRTGGGGGLSAISLNDVTAAFLAADDKSRAMFRKAVGLG